ncbi:MAG: molybdopterin oxidoreductase [Verrucomicrobia bacterium]|jgi:Fe-S-cluster-containing dehydrogenase component/DMSO reductase anchor subunit|nr:molybdopterin oxidoreductase [Verrucomicrobiota bacterium]
MKFVAEEPKITLIDQLLAEQRSLTAVERFANWHDGHSAPAMEARYRSLLPAQPPGKGEQYAFDVDLDVCSGCKACVTACHSLNGLEENETWRGVGLLVPPPAQTEPDEVSILQPKSFHKHVTTACHHCADPGCLNGCPVLAYDKDPLTGIVRHLDDQCIGCQYCVMKCPYDVPKYSERLGIVRKCDMCANRLGVGEAPACVQACPNEAIRIAVVDKAEIISGYRQKDAAATKLNLEGLTKGTSTHLGIGHSFDIRASSLIISGLLPGTPDPAITAPSTRYRSRQPVTDLISGDSHEVHPAQAHVPLSLMLVLTQAGVGMSLFEAISGVANRGQTIFALLISIIGMVAGTLHLGQPLKAWRGFLGWRRSWLSRELIVFGKFIGVLGLHVVLQQPWTAWLAAGVGLIAVFCSAMIYIDTQRPFWSASLTFPKFGLTALLLGWAGTMIFADANVNRFAFGVVLLTLTAVKLAVECSIFSNHQHSPDAPLSKSARLHLTRPLGELFRGRVVLAVISGLLLPLFLLSPSVPLAGMAALIFCFCVAGEIIERHLYFVAEAARKMPGSI